MPRKYTGVLWILGLLLSIIGFEESDIMPDGTWVS